MTAASRDFDAGLDEPPLLPTDSAVTGWWHRERKVPQCCPFRVSPGHFPLGGLMPQQQRDAADQMQTALQW